MAPAVALMQTSARGGLERRTPSSAAWCWALEPPMSCQLLLTWLLREDGQVLDMGTNPPSSPQLGLQSQPGAPRLNEG